MYNAAEAFYFAEILTTLNFNSDFIDPQKYDNVADAARAAVRALDGKNQLGAPPIVNLGFSIELYIKFLLSLSGHSNARGHDLSKLFDCLDRVNPDVSRDVMASHRYAQGCRTEFLEYIQNEAQVFSEWRYAHEAPCLVSSADTLFDLANAFRTTVRQRYPDIRSAFAG